MVLFHGARNAEMQHNAARLEAMGLGRDVGGDAALAAGEAARLAHVGLPPRPAPGTDGIARAATWLLEHFVGARASVTA